MKSRSARTLQKILISILSFLLVIIFAALIIFFWYFPRFLREKHSIEIISESGQMTNRIMSYNLRCLTPLDLGKKSWFYRADLIAGDLEEQCPTVIGFQEATQWQYDYLVDLLPQYDSVITYRDESIIAEGCPIFYHTDRYTLVDKGSFWLSGTPDIMSKDWGAAHFRVCSYVILEEKQSGKQLVVFNTHLDHVSDEARIKGIGVVLDKIKEFGSLPSVIMGDLNATEDSATYVNVTENFLDARYEAKETIDSYTYQNWGNLESSRRIDYFMVSKQGFEVLRYQVLTETHDGIYSSDHCPIVLDILLE